MRLLRELRRGRAETPHAVRAARVWRALAATLAITAPAFAGEASEPASTLVRGRVIEAFTGKALTNASVSAGSVSATTDAGGGFELRLAPGTWTLETRAAGHLSEQRVLVLEAGAERDVDIYLIDRDRLKEDVTVVGRVGASADEPATLPLETGVVLGTAGSADNVFRTLQTLPGVAGVEEFGSRISVRGGGPDQNLTLMDGVEVHNPYRLFGLTSAFNPETIRSFELYTGAFPAKYGDRLSSLLVVDSRSGAGARRLQGTSSLSLTDANVILEGALPGRRGGSWLISGRRTYYDLVANSVVGTDLPSFGDVQARAAWERRPGQRLTLFGLLSRESADASFDGDRPGEQGTFVTGARNDVLALSFYSTLGVRASSRTSLSWYRNTETLDVEALFRDTARRSNSVEDRVAFANANVAFTRALSVRDLALRQELTYEASGRHLLEAGFELHGLDTRVAWRITGERNRSEANASSVRGGLALPDLLDSSRASTRAGAYLQDRIQMMRRLVVEAGLRLDHSGVNGKTTLSPRLRATLLLGPSTRLTAGLGRFTQSPGYEKLVQSDYFVDLTGAGVLPLEHQRASHAVLGLERDLAPGISARVEGYYKSFERLIVGRLESEGERLARVSRYDFPPELRSSVPGSPQITTRPVNGATGRAYGFDVYLVRRATAADSRLSGWASYTYGVATQDAYGRRLPLDYDRRHAFSAVAAMRASRKLELSATARVASGFPYTPVSGLRVSAAPDAADVDRDGNVTELVPERDVNGRYVYTTDRGDVSRLSTGRLPLFARVDLRASFRPKGPNGRWLFYLEVINLLDRDNVGAYEDSLAHAPGAEQPRLIQEPSRSIPLLPSFGVRFRF